MSDDGSSAAEPLSAVGEHSPASWEPPPTGFGSDQASRAEPTDALRLLMGVSLNDVLTQLPSYEQAAIKARTAALVGEETIITRLRAENDALRSEIGGLRLRLESLELSYRAALADRAAPARVVAPLHRAIAARPAAFGLRVGMEF